MFPDTYMSPVRAALGALLVLVHLGVVIGGLTGAWQQTFLDLRVPAMTQPFGDFRVIAAGVESAKQGLDPMVNNPADIRGRPLNYPRVWLLIGRPFSGEIGVIAAGLLFALLFSLAAGWLVAIQRTTAASLAICAVALSSSTWLALERGNNDLLVFALIALVLYIPWRYRSALIGLAAILKVFPVVACVLKALRERTRFNIAVAAVVIVYLATTYADLMRITQITEVSGFLSFGIKSVVILFTSAAPPLPVAPVYAAFAAGTLVAIGLAFSIRLHDKALVFEREAMLLAGGVWAFCFVTASNWDYRLILLMLTIPYFLRPGLKKWERLMGWGTVVLMPVAANFGLLYPGWGDEGLFVNLAAKYLLYCVMVFSVARILIHSDDVRSIFRRGQRLQETRT